MNCTLRVPNATRAAALAQACGVRTFGPRVGSNGFAGGTASLAPSRHSRSCWAGTQESVSRHLLLAGSQPCGDVALHLADPVGVRPRPRPAIVFECAIPHWARIRSALDGPIFGNTSSSSCSLAVLTHSGGSARICASSSLPEASSFFSFAGASRISFACCTQALFTQSGRNRRRGALPTDTQAMLRARSQGAQPHARDRPAPGALAEARSRGQG